MNKKSELLLSTFLVLIALFFIEVTYLVSVKEKSGHEVNGKREFVQSVGIPDLAISTEASYVRHRSLSDFFSIYRDDGALREYFASTFVFNSPNSIKSKNEK